MLKDDVVKFKGGKLIEFILGGLVEFLLVVFDKFVVLLQLWVDVKVKYMMWEFLVQIVQCVGQMFYMGVLGSGVLLVIGKLLLVIVGGIKNVFFYQVVIVFVVFGVMVYIGVMNQYMVIMVKNNWCEVVMDLGLMLQVW